MCNQMKWNVILRTRWAIVNRLLMVIWRWSSFTGRTCNLRETLHLHCSILLLWNNNILFGDNEILIQSSVIHGYVGKKKEAPLPRRWTGRDWERPTEIISVKCILTSSTYIFIPTPTKHRLINGGKWKNEATSIKYNHFDLISKGQSRNQSTVPLCYNYRSRRVKQLMGILYRVLVRR